MHGWSKPHLDSGDGTTDPDGAQLDADSRSIGHAASLADRGDLPGPGGSAGVRV
jgi:hypothetical protein